MDMTEEDEFDSDDTEFLHKKIPGITLQKPACFCNGGAYCENHQGNEPKMMGLIKLLTNQFQEVNADEKEQDSHLSHIQTEVEEVFVSRQDVSFI